MRPLKVKAAILTASLSTLLACSSASRQSDSVSGIDAIGLSIELEVSLLADQDQSSIGISPYDRVRTAYKSLEEWKSDYLAYSSLPGIKEMLEGLPKKKLVVFVYSKRKRMLGGPPLLGGPSILFIDAKEMKIAGRYRSR